MKKYIKYIFFGIFILIFILFLIKIYFLIVLSPAVDIYINDTKLHIDEEILENFDEFNFESLNTFKDTIIKVKCEKASIKINGHKVKNKISLGKIKIDEKNKIKVQIKFSGNSKIYKINLNTFPSDFQKFSVTGESLDNKDFYLATYYGIPTNYVYILNKKGELIFYKKTNNRVFNFKKNVIGKKIRYTYLESSDKRYEGNNSALPCKLVVLDENFKKINEIYFKDGKKYINTENHDYYYLGDNHYIIGAYKKEKLKIGFKVWDFKLQEIKDDKILWEFDSDSYFELLEYYNDNFSFSNEKYLNYMHFNSMEIDPKDNNLICSFRNQDSIMKINRKTGKIMWILGGEGDQFGLKEEEKFSKQHSISYLKTGEILIFDNGENNLKTRIIKIKINEKEKKVESFKSYDLGKFYPRMGSVEAVDEDRDIYLLAYGTGTSEYALEEINLETREVYFGLKFVEHEEFYCANKF